MIKTFLDTTENIAYVMLKRAIKETVLPRPRKPRFVSGFPAMTAFVPQGLPATGEVSLTVEELEAIRLSDFEGLDQEAAAGMMGVSRHTFGRVLAGARAVVAEALVTSKALRIEGGTFQIRGPHRRRRRGGGPL
jgi:predicted DNA-binding protein (UPF0251 family)